MWCREQHEGGEGHGAGGRRGVRQRWGLSRVQGPWDRGVTGGSVRLQTGQERPSEGRRPRRRQQTAGVYELDSAAIRTCLEHQSVGNAEGPPR